MHTQINKVRWELKANYEDSYAILEYHDVESLDVRNLDLEQYEWEEYLITKAHKEAQCIYYKVTLVTKD